MPPLPPNTAVNEYYVHVVRPPLPVELDERELGRFIDWLPAIGPDGAYMLQLVAHSSGVEEPGFKGGSHVLEHRLVPGYKPYWRRALRLEVLRHALLQAYADKLYAHHSPPRAVAIYIQLNPAKLIDAVVDAVKDVIDGLREVAVAAQRRRLGGEAPGVTHRPDLRFYAACARRVETRFHVIDVGDRGLFKEVLGAVQDFLGYKPAVIFAGRVGHILLPVHGLGRRQLKQYLGGNGLFEEIAGLGRGNRDPDTGAPLVEAREQALVPVPGTRHGGAIVRFEPEER